MRQDKRALLRADAIAGLDAMPEGQMRVTIVDDRRGDGDNLMDDGAGLMSQNLAELMPGEGCALANQAG